MGRFTNASATLELKATGIPARTLVSASNTIGLGSQTFALADTTPAAYAVRAIAATVGAVFELNLLTNQATSDAWTAGSAQARAAYAVGTITGSGSLDVEFNDALLGTILIPVPVLMDDTAEQWADKVIAVLQANADLAAYTVSGGGGQILITKKPVASFTGEGTDTVPVYGIVDGTFDFEIQAGTATIAGLPIASSEFAAGEATDGILPFDVGGIDFEGIDLPAILSVPGLLIEAVSGDWSYVSGTSEMGFMVSGEKRLIVGTAGTSTPLADNTWDFTCESTPALLRIVVIGNTSA